MTVKSIYSYSSDLCLPMKQQIRSVWLRCQLRCEAWQCVLRQEHLRPGESWAVERIALVATVASPHHTRVRRTVSVARWALGLTVAGMLTIAHAPEIVFLSNVGM